MTAYLVLGVIKGLTIALLAIGVVLIYKAGRFVNFAQAQLGVLSSLLLAKAALDWGWPYWAAFPCAVAVGGGLGAACEYVVIRRLAGRSPISMLVASIGLSQVLLALSLFRWIGPKLQRVTLAGYPLPFHARVHVGSLVLLGNHILTLVLVPVLVIGLTVFFKSTSTGRAIRAAASNPDAAGLAGISIGRVSTLTWAMAGMLSAISAILVAPDQSVAQLQTIGPTLLLEALGAAALAGFVNLPAACGTGIGIGVLEAVVLRVTHSGGTATLYVLGAIVAGLLARGRVIAASDRGSIGERPDVHDVSVRVPAEIADRFIVRHARLLLVVGGIVLAVVAPLLPGVRAPDRTFILALTIVVALAAISLTVLVGWAGQVSLGQFAFVGLGAFISARLAAHGWSLPACLIVVGLIGAAVAAVLGSPSLRLPGLTLAVTTLGFGVVAPNWLFTQTWFSPGGGFATALPVRVAGLGRLGSQRGIYYVALVVLGLAAASLAALRRAAPGRAILAVRDNEATAAAFGVSPSGVKLVAFALSGFLAAAAGVLWAGVYHSVDAHLFDPQRSLLLLGIPVIGGLTSVAGAIVAAFAIFGLPELLHDLFGSVFGPTLQIQLLIGGGGLLLTLIANPGGLSGAGRRGWERLLGRIAAEVRLRAEADRPPEAVAAQPALRATDIVVTFGGIRAVDHTTIEVNAGEIVGLIGGNGAGKTTLLNAISGAIAVEQGSITVFGREVAHLSPDLRAHLGIARSFQAARLFPGLTVLETVQVALQANRRVGTLAALISAPWVRFTERATRAQAEEIIENFGLRGWADERTGNLSTGTRRVCDLAAQVAAAPKLLLLDEPTAGVAQRDAEAFGPLIRSIAGRLNCAVLVIEHDMPLLLAISDRIYCMEAGRIIAHGTPVDIAHDPAVIASYFGTSEQAIGRSGRPKPTAHNDVGPGSANGHRPGSPAPKRRPRSENAPRAAAATRTRKTTATSPRKEQP